MSTKNKLEFVYAMAKYSDAPIHDCYRLIRLGATYVRIDTELTNGYKTKAGEWDEARTKAMTAKLERIGGKIEAICKPLGLNVIYGALTVSVVFADGREAHIP